MSVNSEKLKVFEAFAGYGSQVSEESYGVLAISKTFSREYFNEHHSVQTSENQLTLF